MPARALDLTGLLHHPAYGLLARLTLTLPFWWSGLAKALDFNAAIAEARHFGLEPAAGIAALTILVQLTGSALVIARRSAWLGAGGLGVFTILATVIAHAFWTVEDPAARHRDLNIFLEHLGLVGGLMLAATSPPPRQAPGHG